MLHDLVITETNNAPGHYRVSWAPPGFELDKDQYPGLIDIKDYRSGTTSWHIPKNFIHAGELPGRVLGYDIEPYSKTASGLQLLEHQLRGVTFLRHQYWKTHGKILAADPGLGKTLSALHALWLDGMLSAPGLIVGPGGSTGVWCGEESDAWRHYGLEVTRLNGKAADIAQVRQAPHRWVYCSYDILPTWISLLYMQLKPCTVIFDESHYLMNPGGQSSKAKKAALKSGSERWKAALSASSWDSVLRRYLLTGSPIPKTRMDLYGQLAVAQPQQWGSYVSFGIRYAGGHREAHESGANFLVFDEKTNTTELRARLAGTFLRITEVDAPGAVPEISRERIEVQLPQHLRNRYDLASSDVQVYLQRFKPGSVLAKRAGSIELNGVEYDVEDLGEGKGTSLVLVGILRSIAADGKLVPAVDKSLELLQKHPRLVIVTWKRDSAKQIHKMLKERLSDTEICVLGPIDGNDALSKREAAADAMAAAPRAVLVATRGSMGISINKLVASDAILQETIDWNPDGNIQTERRIQRMSSPFKKVYSYYLIAEDTIDERALELLKEKAEEAHNISDSDRIGLELVGDIDPDSFKDRWSVDQLMDYLDSLAGKEEVDVL